MEGLEQAQRGETRPAEDVSLNSAQNTAYRVEFTPRAISDLDEVTNG